MHLPGNASDFKSREINDNSGMMFYLTQILARAYMSGSARVGGFFPCFVINVFL